MAIVERHKSPDGLMELLIDCTAGDWTIGFAGYAFHTHGDILAATQYPGSPEAAARAFIDDIILSRRLIIVVRMSGRIHDFAVPDDPDQDFQKDAPPGETIEKRFWDGRLYKG